MVRELAPVHCTLLYTKEYTKVTSVCCPAGAQWKVRSVGGGGSEWGRGGEASGGGGGSEWKEGGEASGGGELAGIAELIEMEFTCDYRNLYEVLIMGIKNRLLGIQVNNKNRESREKRQQQEMKTMYEELEGKNSEGWKR